MDCSNIFLTVEGKDYPEHHYKPVDWNENATHAQNRDVWLECCRIGKTIVNNTDEGLPLTYHEFVSRTHVGICSMMMFF